MQKMQCRKGNAGTHSMQILGVEKGFAKMELEQINEASLSGIVALSKGAGLLNRPFEFK